jgi:hypothetical protein
MCKEWKIAQITFKLLTVREEKYKTTEKEREKS